VKLTKKQRDALGWMEQAADSGELSLMGAGATDWYGDLWVNHLTAKALQRKGLIEIEWGTFPDDDHLLHLVREES